MPPYGYVWLRPGLLPPARRKPCTGKPWSARCDRGRAPVHTWSKRQRCGTAQWLPGAARLMRGPCKRGVAWVCPTIAVCGLSICKDKINRREYKKNGLVFKPAPPPGRHRQSDSGRKHGRARHVVQPEQKKKCPPGLAATAPPGGHHPSCQVAVRNQPISSCSKSTDTIELAGVLYIFATILCALGPHTKV